jgi:pimeloyl-ACP methyl ester carboxylesterase
LTAFFRSRIVTVDGLPWHVLEHGEGVPVVLVHGLGASSHVYDAVMRQASGLACAAVDLPSSGRSARYRHFDPGLLAQELVHVLDALGHEQVVAVGHSFGGVVCLELAARYPTRVRGLLLMSAPALGTAPFEAMLQLPGMQWMAQWVTQLAAALPPNEGLVRNYLRLLWGEPSSLTDAHVAAYVAAARADGFYPAMLEGLRHLTSYRIPIEKLKKAGIPCTVLWGDKDRLVPVAQGQVLARAVGATFRVVADTGQCVPEERPEAVLAELRALLAAR